MLMFLQNWFTKPYTNVKVNGQKEIFEMTSVECILESLSGKSFKITALRTKVLQQLKS